MDKSFSPQDIEARLYGEWEARGYFRPSGTGTPNLSAAFTTASCNSSRDPMG